MTWQVMIGAEEPPWVAHAVPLDPPSGWKEAWNDAIPRYRQARYETEAEASCYARLFLALGFSAATEYVADASPAPEHADA